MTDVLHNDWPPVHEYLGLGLLVLVLVFMSWHWAQKFRAQRHAHAFPQERQFAVRPADLQQAMTLEAIEAAEMRDHPQGAAPPVPFGHQYPGWRRFINGLDIDDEIWRFVAVRRSYPKAPSSAPAMPWCAGAG